MQHILFETILTKRIDHKENMFTVNLINYICLPPTNARFINIFYYFVFILKIFPPKSF